MYIVNDSQRSVSHGQARHEMLRRWVEELLVSENVEGAAADDIQDAVVRKLRLRAQVGRRQTAGF
jgi:hypothetical protein